MKCWVIALESNAKAQQSSHKAKKKNSHLEFATARRGPRVEDLLGLVLRRLAIVARRLDHAIGIFVFVVVVLLVHLNHGAGLPG